MSCTGIRRLPTGCVRQPEHLVLVGLAAPLALTVAAVSGQPLVDVLARVADRFADLAEDFAAFCGLRGLVCAAFLADVLGLGLP